MPAAVAIGIWLLLHITYDLLGYIENIHLYRTLASINWILLVISVGFSSVVVYPITYFRGASFRMRVLASYALPIAWCIKEFIRVSANVTVAEALFFVLFTSIQLLILIGQVGLIGIAEMVCRSRSSIMSEGKKVINAGSIIAILFTITFLYFALIRGGGYDFHLMVKMIYRSMFL